MQWGGINNLWAMNPTPFAPASGPMQPNGGSATFNAYVDNVSGQVAAQMLPTKVGTPVIVADPNYIYQKLNMPLKYGTDGNPGRYLVFAPGYQVHDRGSYELRFEQCADEFRRA